MSCTTERWDDALGLMVHLDSWSDIAITMFTCANFTRISPKIKTDENETHLPVTKENSPIPQVNKRNSSIQNGEMPCIQSIRPEKFITADAPRNLHQHHGKHSNVYLCVDVYLSVSVDVDVNVNVIG